MPCWNLSIGEAVLIERLAGRLVCPVCSRVYHVRALPAAASRVSATVTGRALVRRPDDAPDAVRHRFEVYETADRCRCASIMPRRVCCRTVEAEGDPDDVTAALGRIVGRVGEWAENRASWGIIRR